MTVRKTAERCIICTAIYSGYGHNAEPVAAGRCCTLCNDTVVIPARIGRIARTTPTTEAGMLLCPACGGIDN